MTWTYERTEQLKSLWADGQSASAIAAQLGHVTRNAVIGKVHRLGLAGRPKAPRRERAARRSSTARRLHRRATRLSNVPQPPIASKKVAASLAERLGPAPPAAVTIATLTEHTCRWPEGDPKIPGFHFCGRQKSSCSSP
jgi:GcrA cell cycle regulator